MNKIFNLKAFTKSYIGMNILVIALFYIISWLFGGFAFTKISKWQGVVIISLMILDIWAIYYQAIVIKYKEKNKQFKNQYITTLFITFYVFVAFFRIYITGFLLNKLSSIYNIHDDNLLTLAIGKEVIILLLLLSVGKINFKPSKTFTSISKVVIFLFTTICFITIKDLFENSNLYLRKYIEISYVDAGDSFGDIIISTVINIFFAGVGYIASHFVLIFLKSTKRTAALNVLSLSIIVFIIIEPLYFNSSTIVKDFHEKIEEAKETKILDCNSCGLGKLGFARYIDFEPQSKEILKIKELTDLKTIDLSNNNIYPLYFIGAYNNQYGYHFIDTLFKSFREMKNLKNLYLNNNLFNHQNFKSLATDAIFENLVELDLSYTNMWFGDDSTNLNHIFPNLKTLYCKQHESISDYSVKKIAEIVSLDTLVIRNSTLSINQKAILYSQNKLLTIIEEK